MYASGACTVCEPSVTVRGYNRSSNHNERKKKATTQIGQSKREKSTRGDGICVGNLISALPRLLGLAAAHAAVVEQHAEVQMVQEASQHVQEARRRRKRMGTFAAVRVSSNRVEPHHHSSTAVALCQLARHFQPQATLPQDPASSCTRLRRKTCAALGRKAPCSARIRSRGSKV